MEDQNRNIDANLIELKDIINLATKEAIIFSIQKLRNLTPIRCKTFKKLIKGKFNENSLDPDETIQTLNKKGIIKIFNFPSKYDQIKNKDSEEYICLIQDIMGIKKPSIGINNLLNQGGFSKDLKNEYTTHMKNYFLKYSKKKGIGDDADVYEIFIDKELSNLIEYLSNNIIDIDDPPKELILSFGDLEHLNKLLKSLQDSGFLLILEDKKFKHKKFALLLAEIEVKFVFPEYLINNISARLRDESINKDIALTTLNILKNAYLKNENRDLYDKINETIKNQIKNYENTNNNNEKLSIIDNIIENYIKISEIDKIEEWKKTRENLS